MSDGGGMIHALPSLDIMRMQRIAPRPVLGVHPLGILAGELEDFGFELFVGHGSKLLVRVASSSKEKLFKVLHTNSN